MADPKDWKKFEGWSSRRTVETIPFTRGDGNEDGDELSNVNITEEELATLKDGRGEIHFYKVFKWLLPQYSNDSFWEFLAAQLRNYMIHITKTQGYNPHFYDPEEEVVITTGHVARFFGCQMGHILLGFPSIKKTWSTRKSLNAVSTAVDSMTQDPFKDIHRCMHFSDNWDKEDAVDWDVVYFDAKYNPSPGVVKHRQKF